MHTQNIEDSLINEAHLLEILADKDTQLILESVRDSPKKTSQLCDECKIPTSTAYRKVQKLVECRILQKIGKINEAGKRETSYKSSAWFTKIFLKNHLLN